MPSTDYTPSLAEVGSLIPSRTKDDNGNELGTFTTATHPTAAQVSNLILMALSEVEGAVGSDIHEDLWPAARTVVAYRTVILIELTYFPEQVRSERSVFDERVAIYEASLKSVARNAEHMDNSGEQGAVDDAALPAYNFPVDAGGMLGWGTRW